MVAWRYEISLLVLKNISLVKYFSTREEKRPCDILHISYHVMSCHVMSCHVMSCHVMSCHVMSYIISSSYRIISYHTLYIISYLPLGLGFLCSHRESNLIFHAHCLLSKKAGLKQ